MNTSSKAADFAIDFIIKNENITPVLAAFRGYMAGHEDGIKDKKELLEKFSAGLIELIKTATKKTLE